MWRGAQPDSGKDSEVTAAARPGEESAASACCSCGGGGPIEGSLEAFNAWCGSLDANRDVGDVTTVRGATGQLISGEGACLAVEYHCSEGPYGPCHTISTTQYPMKGWGWPSDEKRRKNDFDGFMEFCQSWQQNKGFDVAKTFGISGQTVGGAGACAPQVGIMNCHAGLEGACVEFNSVIDFPMTTWNGKGGRIGEFSGFAKWCASWPQNVADGITPETVTSTRSTATGRRIASMGPCLPPLPPPACVDCTCCDDGGGEIFVRARIAASARWCAAADQNGMLLVADLRREGNARPAAGSVR